VSLTGLASVMRRLSLILLGGLAAGACGSGDNGNGPPTITSVVVSGDSTVIVAGTQQLTATAMAGSTPLATGVTFQWMSSDTTRARVSGSGLVTGVRPGSTNITARAVLNGTPTSALSSPKAIRARIASIVLTPTSSTFAALYDTVYVTAEARDALNGSVAGVTFTWLSRDAAVATAADSGPRKGAVVAISNGAARIVASGDGLSDSVTVTVNQIAASVWLLPANIGTPAVTMLTSQTAPFYAVVRDSNNYDDPRPLTGVAWSVSPGTSVSVSASTTGTVTVTTNATPGSDTVQATIGALAGQRVVSVSTTGVSFSGDVQPVLSGCTGCHSGASPPQGLSLASGASYGNLADVNAGQVPTMKRVRPFQPDSSYLTHKIQGTQTSVGGRGSRMPLGCAGAGCLSDVTINMIRNWILQGAANN
jgi:hypothetical protein